MGQACNLAEQEQYRSLYATKIFSLASCGVHAVVFFFNIVLQYGNLNIPDLECTAGIVLVFLQVKKRKNRGWMSCSTLERLYYRWRWLMNFRYILQRGPTAMWWNFGKVKMDGLYEVLLLTPYPNCLTLLEHSPLVLQYLNGTLSLLPCTRWYFQVWDTVLPGNFQHALEAFYMEGPQLSEMCEVSMFHIHTEMWIYELPEKLQCWYSGASSWRWRLAFWGIWTSMSPVEACSV